MRIDLPALQTDSAPASPTATNTSVAGRGRRAEGARQGDTGPQVRDGQTGGSMTVGEPLLGAGDGRLEGADLC